MIQIVKVHLGDIFDAAADLKSVCLKMNSVACAVCIFRSDTDFVRALHVCQAFNLIRWYSLNLFHAPHIYFFDEVECLIFTGFVDDIDYNCIWL